MHARHSIFQAIRDGIALALSVAATGTLAVFLAVTSAHAATVAHAATGTVAHAATPAQQACSAFARWQQDETPARLGRLVTAAARLPRSYLKADVFQLAADASSPSAKSRKYVSDDTQYVFSDCHDGYGL